MCEEAGHPPSTHICVDDDEMSSYISADADRCVGKQHFSHAENFEFLVLLHEVDSESECPTSHVRQGP